jgi:hypothetical protein
VLIDNTGRLSEVAAPWSSRVDLAAYPLEPATAMLIRADGYVAWSSESAEPDSGALVGALTRWFGKA